MSQHPSLRSSDKDKKNRSVLKRYERVRALRDKEKWQDEDSVFGLQKVKVVRFKVKKEKAAAAETAEGAAAPAAQGAAAPAAAGAAKAQSPQAKAPAAKEAAKPKAAGEAKK